MAEQFGLCILKKNNHYDTGNRSITYLTYIFIDFIFRVVYVFVNSVEPQLGTDHD